MIEFGLKFRLVFSCPLLAQGSPLVEFMGATKSIRQNIQEWDSLQTGWNDF